MKHRSLTHVADDDLLRDGSIAAAHERGRTADLLAYIAEIDARKLYLREACDSMQDYCIRRMRLEEHAARKRIHVARTARRFPAIFDAVDDGRLHLAGVVLLAPHLTEANADQLVAVAAGKSKRRIEELLAERFPRTEMLTLVQALPATSVASRPGDAAHEVDVRSQSRSRAPGRVECAAPRPEVTPMAPGRYALQTMLDRNTFEDLEYARALLGHRVPSEAISEVLAGALRAYVGILEKKRFAATSRPRAGRSCSWLRPRHIPRSVKHAVWVRDGGQCTFTNDRGERCPARTRLEFDHIDPVARGGQGTIENLRLVCRAHNQYLAERAFGAGFMHEKREAAQRAAVVRRRETAGRAMEGAVARRQEVAAQAEEAALREAEEARIDAAVDEIVTPLRLLGCRKEEALRIAATCAPIADTPLEERLRFAIRQLAPRRRTAGPTRVTAT